MTRPSARSVSDAIGWTSTLHDKSGCARAAGSRGPGPGSAPAAEVHLSAVRGGYRDAGVHLAGGGRR
ncbi:hypothetical protein ACFPM0_32370 [Pseudonocardia sulfidoxydans]|uniref:hypothetical protein n=1 Tax=Pseudonocardia sulfidoxydans TaxID=54011 RepID=UPI00361E07C8